VAKPIKFARDVFEWRGLAVSSSAFRCQYCGKTWERGGHKEGFVKASASRHAYNCWQVGLFLRGYVVSAWQRGGETVMTIAEAKERESRGVLHKGNVRLYQQAAARRRREGVLDVLRPRVAS
jgi:hypothetical protein